MAKNNSTEKKENTTVKLDIPGPKTIVKETKDSLPFDKKIEDERLNLQAMFKKSKTESNIYMVICVLLLIAGMILSLYKENSFMPIIGYCLMGLALVILIVHFILTKNKFPNATKRYISLVTETLNSHIFSSTKFKDLTTDPLEKVEQSDVLADGVYNMITNIGSINVVRGLYDNRSFKIGDVALYKSGIKKGSPEVLFIGKYLTYPNNLHFDGRIVISIYNSLTKEELMPDNSVQNKSQRADTPNNISDLEVLEEIDNITIYGTKGIDYKKVLNSKFINFIKSVQIDKILLNVNIAIWPGHTAAYYSYGDEIVGLPFENKFVGQPINDFKNDLEQLLEGLVTINK